jgi:hypothetical protein
MMLNGGNKVLIGNPHDGQIACHAGLGCLRALFSEV